jgi:hypothetical protein
MSATPPPLTADVAQQARMTRSNHLARVDGGPDRRTSPTCNGAFFCSECDLYERGKLLNPRIKRRGRFACSVICHDKGVPDKIDTSSYFRDRGEGGSGGSGESSEDPEACHQPAKRPHHNPAQERIAELEQQNEELNKYRQLYVDNTMTMTTSASSGLTRTLAS